MSNEPVRVLFLTHRLAVGGAEVLLVSILNALDRAKIEPIVVTLARDGDLEREIADGVRIIRYPRRFKLDFKPFLDIARLVKRERIDRILVLGLSATPFVNLATMRKHRRLKLLVSLHATKPVSVADYVRTLFTFTILDRRAVLVTVCSAQARYLSRKYFVPVRRFITVYNGVDTTHWTPDYPERERASARGRIGIDAGALVILQVAVLRPEKAHQYSIEALAAIHRTTSLKPYLVFVGGGGSEIERRLRDLAKRMAVEGHVVFCGHHADVRAFYRLADLFTLSSVTETLSLAALEAMSSGLPCVLPDLGGAGEIIVEGGNGYIVPAGRPDLLAAAWHRALTGSLTWSAQRIREYVVSRFSLTSCVKSYQDVLLS